MTIQGFALPWNSSAYVEGGSEETVAPRAVAASTPRNIRLLFGDHVDEGREVFAQTRDKSLSFFHDDYGLGFSARLDAAKASHRAAARAVASGSTDECSVNFTAMHRTAEGRILWATIDHVSILTKAAYADTGCWLASVPINERGSRLRGLSMRWTEGLLNYHRRSQLLGRSPAGGAVGGAIPVAPPKSVTMPASVARMMESPEWRMAAEKFQSNAARLRNMLQ